jgi:ubiquinol-cytochrome c reductase iron-sulfur subunit
MSDAERTSRRGGEGPIAVAFAVSIVGALGLAVVYSTGGEPQFEGLFLGMALIGIGVGMALWAMRFLPNDEVEEERGTVGSSEEEIAAFSAVFEQGEHQLARRRLLTRLGLGALGALGLAALFPLRSLGPAPGRGLKQTAFARGGLRLVDEDNRPLRPDDLTPGTVATVFPEGQVDSGDAPTLLIRVETGEIVPLPGREDWTVDDDTIAYSKLCTHLGCPVGLFQAPQNLLLCPCHQSTFDVLHHARPVFGPATRPLPQLPIAVDEDGYFVATGDFSGPVGGGFWDRDR